MHCLPVFSFAIFAACTPLVGAMLDKPRDASTDGPADTVQEVVPYCEDTNPCPAGYVCLKDPCEASIGRCTRKPDTCTGELINEVCGCNTQTYLNECEMLMAGQSKKYDGPCITASCGWDTRLECGPGNYCEGICGDTAGVCLPVPAECHGMPPEEPVCGCNDAGESITYMNQCDRILSNAWYEHPGSCDSVTGCREGDATTACGPTMFCEGDEGACGSGLPGWCVERPLMCDLVYEPVCGCNDMTYGNDCERQMAGVWRNYVGECRGTWINCTIIVTTDGSISQEGCPDNMFCELPPGSCPGNVTTPVDIDLWGICVDSLNCEDPPLACGDDPTPVCGCNSVQYDDDCARRNAKAQVGCCFECADCHPPVF
jgi:hypothetical protein